MCCTELLPQASLSNSGKVRTSRVTKLRLHYLDVVGEEGLEPSRGVTPIDPKSILSTKFQHPPFFERDVIKG